MQKAQKETAKTMTKGDASVWFSMEEDLPANGAHEAQTSASKGHLTAEETGKKNLKTEDIAALKKNGKS